MISATMNILSHVSCCISAWVSPGSIPQSELIVGSYVYECSTLGGNAKVFSKLATQICALSNHTKSVL